MFSLPGQGYFFRNGIMMDPAFKVVAAGRAGFYIWRIEDMKPVLISKDQKMNKFYNGDSYIIYSARELKGTKEQNIHFWLGSKTSQDEAGAAAIKTVELDDYLGGAPVQYREVEGKESKLFLSYFASKGLRIMEGGVKSGFRHVDNVFKVRLYQVKGKRNLRITEVDIAWESMNHGDAYILDLGKVLFIWIGRDSSRKENFRAVEHARALRDERDGGSIIFVDDGQEEKMTKDEKLLFEQHLPLSEVSKVKATDAVVADNLFERKSAENMKLFSCREEDGNLTIKEVKTGPLSRKDLTSDDSYIIDYGPEHIWVWIGKQATKGERAEAMRNAVGFIQKKGYPTDTCVTRVVDGGEPADFKCLFPDWPQPPPPGKVYSRSRIAKTVQTKFDASTLHTNTALAAECQMFDDGQGNVEIYQVVNFELEPVDKNTFGDFYAGDSYVIKYTYNVKGREHYIIYYWQGLKSTADERGTSAAMAVKMDDELHGAATQIRVVQNKEPPHFMAMFHGKMVIFDGGKAGWQKGDKDQGPGDTYMLQVRGTSELNSKAVQVPLTAASLNSNDVFVIFSRTATYIWTGKGSTGDERGYAKNIATRSPREPVMVFEGQEKEDFWKVLGGKAEYASDKRLQEEECAHPPRLFQLSNASGNICCEEINDFVQTDLVPEDVMILDVWDSVYLWIGANANKQEKEGAERIAIQYIETDPAGRDKDTPIARVKQGFEPPTFTGFFGVWDPSLWSKGKTYEQLKAELGQEAVQVSLVQQAMNGNDQNFNEVPKYSYDQLIVASEDLPNDVNAENRELHLSPDEFQQYFKCSYEDFVKKPVWKQQQTKKNLKLF